MIKSTALNKLVKSSVLLAFSLFALGLSGKANTADNVNNGSTDLTAPATYSLGTVPTSANDLTFTNTAYSPAAFTLNTPGYNLSTGTLDDLSTTPLTIQNTVAGSYSTITLNGGSNGSTGAATTDLLYVASGASLTVGGGSGGLLSLAVATAGNLDVVGSATIAGPLTGTVALSKTGAGTLDLSGGFPSVLAGAGPSASLPLYTGTLTISAGQVELSNTTALEGATVLNNSTGAVGLVFDSAVTSDVFDVGGLSSSSATSTLALTDTSSNAATLVLGQNNLGLDTTATNSTYAGVLSGAGGITKVGSTTQTLSGANLYTGTTTVDGGTLALSGSLNGTTGTALVLGGGTLNYSKGSTTQNFTGTTINAGSSFVIASGTSSVVALGAITHNADSAVDFNPSGGSSSITTTSIATTTGFNQNGIIGGWATEGNQTTFAVAPASSGGAITGLATANYTSSATAGTTGTNYSNANIDMLASEAIASGTITPNAIRFNTSTAYTLTLNTGVNTIESGGILVTSAATNGGTITGGTITSGTQELDATVVKTLNLSSIIADNGNPVALVLDGSGTLSVDGSGQTNTYTGGTYVNNGTLSLGANALSASTGVITLGAVGSSAAANIETGSTVNYANAITVNPGGEREIFTGGSPAPTFSGAITLVGGATLGVGPNGNSSFTLSGGITGTGNIEIGGENASRQGTVHITTNAINITGTLSDVYTGNSTTGFQNTGGNLVSSNVIGNTAILQDGGSSTFVFSGLNTNTGATTISAGTLQLGGSVSNSLVVTAATASASSSLSPNSDIVDNGTFVIDETGTITQGTNFSTAGITGTGALTLYGTGTTILTAANAYTGATSILTDTANPTAGTLQLGNGGTAGSLSSSSTIVDNGTFAVDRSNTVTEGTDFAAAASFTGTGGFAQIGSGTTILLGANAYAGATTITTGTLQLGNGTTNGTLATTSAITDNGTLTFDENTAVAQGTGFDMAAITGSGAVTVEGSGAVTLNAANTFTSLLDLGSINFATVAASGAQSLGSGPITLGNGTVTSASLAYTGAVGTLGDSITVATGDQATITNNGTGILTLAGAISKNGSVLNLVGGTNNFGFNVSGAITGTLAGSDLNVINTVVTLSNAGNNFNGPTTISGSPTGTITADVLQSTVAGALSPNSVVNLGSTMLETNTAGYTNILDLDGTAQTVAGLASVNDSLSGTVVDNNEVVNSTGSSPYNAANATTGTLTIAPAAGTSYTFGGTVGGTGSANNVAVVVNGASTGTQAFTGANTYTGGTTVTSGTLQAGNAAALGTGNVTVNGGTLQGTVSTIDIASNFSLSSGVLQENTAGTGTFTLTGSTNSFAISGGTWDLDIAGAPSSNNYDMVDSSSLTNLFTISGGTLNLVGSGLTAGTYDILNGFSAASSGGFSAINTNNSAYSATFQEVNGTGELVVVSSAPEPTTWAMLLGGVVLLVTIQRRRRASRI
jgi:fibronectin-binding autotransporter adhesin